MALYNALEKKDFSMSDQKQSNHGFILVQKALRKRIEKRDANNNNLPRCSKQRTVARGESSPEFSYQSKPKTSMLGIQTLHRSQIFLKILVKWDSDFEIDTAAL